MIATETKKYIVRGNEIPELVVEIYHDHELAFTEHRAHFRFFFEAEAAAAMFNEYLQKRGTLEVGK